MVLNNNTMVMSSEERNYGLIRANEVISRFITSCSHSMRGPLKSIQGLVNLLQNAKSYSDQERQVFLELIVNTSVKMENMLDELEHFLENTKRDMTTQKIELSEMIREILATHQEQLDQLSMRVSVDVDRVNSLTSDPHRLRLVLNSLISNALCFYDSQKEVKTLTIEAKENEGNVTLVVADNGIGIDPSQHRKIFQLFYRASERSGGAGIGLYVVKEILNKMGSEVEVESALGEGSSFFVRIPTDSAASPRP